MESLPRSLQKMPENVHIGEITLDLEGAFRYPFANDPSQDNIKLASMEHVLKNGSPEVKEEALKKLDEWIFKPEISSALQMALCVIRNNFLQFSRLDAAITKLNGNETALIAAIYCAWEGDTETTKSLLDTHGLGKENPLYKPGNFMQDIADFNKNVLVTLFPGNTELTQRIQIVVNHYIQTTLFEKLGWSDKLSFPNLDGKNYEAQKALVHKWCEPKIHNMLMDPDQCSIA